MTSENIEKLSFDHPVILYDGLCMLCNKFIIWLIEHDIEEVFRYAALQSLPHIVAQLPKSDNDTIVLYKKGKLYTHSDVGLLAFKTLGGWWQVFSILLYAPNSIRDTVYRFIAKHRYTWFGKLDQCMLMPEEKKHLFLD